MVDAGRDAGPLDAEGTVHEQYDWEAISPSAAVVQTVATTIGRDSTALDPLYESVNPEALDTLVGPRATTPDATRVVSFPYAGFDVTVYSTGEVELRPSPEL